MARISRASLGTNHRGLLRDVRSQHPGGGRGAPRTYLDFEGPRKARGGRSKVTWQDGYGNKHDLDYVLERGGTEETRGVPVAFIESAWRRYTKHSKNKAQEIEAAVMPVALTFSRHQPFCGAVVAGEVTEHALHQLESKGFAVLHVPYESILAGSRNWASMLPRRTAWVARPRMSFGRRLRNGSRCPSRRRQSDWWPSSVRSTAATSPFSGSVLKPPSPAESLPCA